MVEMTKLLRNIGLLGALLFGAAGAGASQPPVEARIAGLESNGEYMSLLEEDARLQEREDSVGRAVEGLRHRLRDDLKADRAALADEILELENRIFEIRTAKGRIIDRINTIEQEWVLANLNRGTDGPEPAAPPATAVRTAGLRNLTDNACFRDELPAQDYAALQQAQRLERQAADRMRRYCANHATLGQLAEAYRAATAEAEALEIYAGYQALDAQNRALADSLSAMWNYIFDNKSYAYDYVLDKLGQTELLAAQTDALAETARTYAELQGTTASDEVADYVLRKQVLVDYEVAVARALGLERAADSLRGVSMQLCTVDCRLPRLEIEERSFVVYEDVAFPSASPYDARNPIPECRIYSRGTVYRILLGRFSSKRPVSAFRGAAPLSYRIDGDGKWCYYAGGFATRSEAEAAQARLKKRGFARPEIVVWTDGAYRNVSLDGDAAEAFRVEIASPGPLSDEVKQAIARTARGAGLSRAGQKFIVGMFDDRAVAEQVVQAVRRADPELEIKIAETSE